MNKKKIILVLLEPPSPFGGAAGRWYYVLCNELIKRNYELHIFAACSSLKDLEDSRKLFPDYLLKLYFFPQKKFIISKIQTLISPYSYMFDKSMLNDIETEIQNGYDIIHLEQMWSGWTMLKNSIDTSKSLLNIHYLTNIDLEFSPEIKLKNKFTTWLMKKTEKKISSRFQNVRSITPRLKIQLEKWNPTSNNYFSPFGIDSKLYQYIDISKRNQGKTISLIASMNWYPGYSAAINLIENLWPKIKEKNPDAKLQIVGWGARKALATYLNLNDVKILENVPSTKEYFENSSLILYAPKRGSGIKVKILEAMLFGIPVVTTEEGMEGIEFENGIHALVGSNDQELIHLADKLLNDLDLQEKIRKSGRELIEKQLSPERTVNDLLAIYNKILS